MKTETEVLIVGAGPTGLSLACQFIRYGIDFVIVEKNEALTPYSKAIGVQARTLEIFDQIGLAQQAVRQGSIAARARLLIDGEIRGEIDFRNIGEGLSPFPFVLMLEQSKTEKLLFDYVRDQGHDVEWKTELDKFSLDATGITAHVKTSDGNSQSIKARYIVGCDGPKSVVRHILGLTFGGSTFERIFYVADAQIEWQLSHDALHISFAEDSFVVFFPLKGEKRYRIVGVFPEEFGKDEGEILYEEIEARIKSEVKLDLDIHDVEWFSTYKVHTRHVDRFAAGRGFVAGDAAHIHTPAGAQGMNTGIQDGYNLAWKLAFVLRGNANEKLLATYNEERLENAKNLLQTTDRLFQFAAGSDWLFNLLRLHVLPPLAKYILGSDAVRRYVFPLISQIGINYRHSSLSQHHGDEDFEVKAGDRMPYFLNDRISIYESLREPRLHLVQFANGENGSHKLNDHNMGIDQTIVPIDAHVEDIFGVTESFEILLRPDNHIGMITKENGPQLVQSYLEEWFSG